MCQNCGCSHQHPHDHHQHHHPVGRPRVGAKVAVTGKGGVGKTTLCGLLARLLDELGYRVLAVDADPDANLASALVLNEEQATPLAARPSVIRELAGQGSELPSGFYLLNPDVSSVLPDIRTSWGDGQGLITLGWHKGGGSGCYCVENSVLRRVLDTVLTKPDEIVLVDSEAGLEHFSRGTPRACDTIIVVVEPGQRSLDTARDIRRLAHDLGIDDVIAVLCGYHAKEEIAFVRDALAPIVLAASLSFDEALRRSDLAGQPPELTPSIRASLSPLVGHILAGAAP